MGEVQRLFLLRLRVVSMFGSGAIPPHRLQMRVAGARKGAAMNARSDQVSND